MIIRERWFKTVGLSSVLSSFLYILSIYLPLLGGLISFFSPLPIGYVRIQYTKIETYVSLLIISILLAFIGGSVGVFLFLIQYGIPFLLFIEIFLIRKEPYDSMMYSSLILIFIFYSVFLIFSGFSFEKLNLIFQNYMEKSINIAFKNYSGGLSKAELIEVTTKLKSTVKFLVKILPAIMFMFYSAMMIGNFYVLKRFIYKLNKIDLTGFQAPFIFVWLFIISGFTLIFYKNSWFWYLGLNIFIISSFLFLIQGLCITEYWFKKYQLSSILRGIFIFSIFVFQFIFICIAFLGLFDTWFDYRKLNMKEEKNESNS